MPQTPNFPRIEEEKVLDGYDGGKFKYTRIDLLIQSVNWTRHFWICLHVTLCIAGNSPSPHIMLNLFSLKNEKQNEASSKSGSGKRASAAQLRHESSMLWQSHFAQLLVQCCGNHISPSYWDLALEVQIILHFEFTTDDNIPRITKDINELELPKTCRTEFPGRNTKVSPFIQSNFKLHYSSNRGEHRDITWLHYFT